jgi:hypothetical protein
MKNVKNKKTFKMKNLYFLSFRGNSVVDNLQEYSLWGCIVTEVELDLLTGEKKVKAMSQHNFNNF